MNPKMMIRKKALDMEVMSKPEAPIKKRMMPGMESAEMGDEQKQQEGYEAVLLSPEEKEMIMELRKKAGVGGADEEAAPEALE